MAFLTQNKAKLCKNLIITYVGLWEKRQFFRRKLSKIVENCDHNIDPSIFLAKLNKRMNFSTSPQSEIIHS
jgi:hypothetical protein